MAVPRLEVDIAFGSAVRVGPLLLFLLVDVKIYCFFQITVDSGIREIEN